MEKYTKEDLQIDIGWLEGKGLDRKEAKEFILSLLNSKKSW